MRRPRPRSQTQMTALFLRTEPPAARFRDTLRALPEDAGPPERVITGPHPGGNAENQARPRPLTAHRGHRTRTGPSGGVPGDVRRQWMPIPPAELATARYTGHGHRAGLPGGTRLAAGAAPRTRAGAAPSGVPSDRAPGTARQVARGARSPPLTLATTGPGSDPAVPEGHTPPTACMPARDQLPPEPDALAGSSPATPRRAASGRHKPDLTVL